MIPPDILAGLAGGPPDQGQDPSQGSGDPLDILSQMLDLADQYRSAEPDEEDRLEMEKARTLLQNLLAKDQKEQDGMMQGKVTPRGVRKSMGSQGSGY